MLQDPYTVVILPAQLLNDLLAMARKSPDYRDHGYAWAHSAMHSANRAYTMALYRAGKATDDDKIYLELTTQNSV